MTASLRGDALVVCAPARVYSYVTNSNACNTEFDAVFCQMELNTILSKALVIERSATFAHVEECDFQLFVNAFVNSLKSRLHFVQPLVHAWLHYCYDPSDR